MVDVEHKMVLNHRTPLDVGHVGIEFYTKSEQKDVSSHENALISIYNCCIVLTIPIRILLSNYHINFLVYLYICIVVIQFEAR